MADRASSSSLLLVHLLWPVAEAGETPLTSDARTRLRSYVARYAETLGAHAHAVGGIHDHLHVLIDFPPDKALRGVEDELRRASQRFLRDVLGDRLFAWAEVGACFASVSPAERETVIIYVETQEERHTAGDLRPEWEMSQETIAAPATDGQDDEMPDWLRSALRKPSRG